MQADESDREQEQMWKTVKYRIRGTAEKRIEKSKTTKKIQFNSICEEAIDRKKSGNVQLSNTENVDKLTRFKINLED